MKSYRYTSLICTVFLAACATPYIEPTTNQGPTARLIVRSASLQQGFNSLQTFDNGKNCSGPRVIASSSSQPINLATTIKTGEPVSLRMYYAGYGMICNYIVTFDPKAGHKYLITPFSNATRCGLAVFDATNGNNTLEASTRKRTMTGYISGGFCASDSFEPIKVENDRPSLDDFGDLLPEPQNTPTQPSIKHQAPQKTDASKIKMDDLQDLFPITP